MSYSSDSLSSTFFDLLAEDFGFAPFCEESSGLFLLKREIIDGKLNSPK